MDTNIDNMLNAGFYKSIILSFFNNGWWKALMAVLFSLLEVPLEFVVAMPLFWIMDFGAGIYAARRDAHMKGQESWFKGCKLRAQFVKIAIHMVLLIGCIILANLYDVEQFITFGFGYIICNEFFFSTVPHLVGDKKAAKFAKHFTNQILNFMGVDHTDDNSNKKEI